TPPYEGGAGGVEVVDSAVQARLHPPLRKRKNGGNAAPNSHGPDRIEKPEKLIPGPQIPKTRSGQNREQSEGPSKPKSQPKRAIPLFVTMQPANHRNARHKEHDEHGRKSQKCQVRNVA